VDRWLGTSTGSVFLARSGPIAASLSLRQEDGRLRLDARIRALEALDLAELELAGSFRLGAADSGWALQNGYQSWDEAGHRPVGADGVCESWWTMAIAGEDGWGLAAAAAGAATACTRYRLTGSELDITWCEAPGAHSSRPLRRLGEGETWQPDGLLLDAGPNVRAALGGLSPPEVPAPPAQVPRGWLSWYHFGPWITRQDVISNARALLDGGQGPDHRLILIDDGWQEAYGDWVPNTKFPGGLRSLCDELRPLGFTVGAWTAPFLVSAVSDLARTAPEDWFVHEAATGERYVDPRHVVFGPMHVLDGRHPAVREHLRDTFDGLYQDGVRYFKVDFLYAAAHGGLQSLRQGLAAIRDGVRDAYLLACGAPLLPVVGLVEGCRIGPDTATPWYDFEVGGARPTIFAQEVEAVARNLAARSFLRSWFQLDADVALVGGNLTLEQGRQLVTLAVLSGGPFMAGDDLPNLPSERLALLTNPEVLALAGGEAALPDWEPSAASPPTHWRRGDVLAVFNWAAEDRAVDVRAPGAVSARDLWARRDLPWFRDGVSLYMPAGSVSLLRLDGA
jgi:Melibiase